MIINRWLISHPGKTAGTSVEQALLKHELGKSLFDLNAKSADYKMMYGWDKNKGLYLHHCDLYFLQHHTDIKISDYESLSLVRNPLTRLLSAYFYNSVNKRCSLFYFVQMELQKTFEKNQPYTKNHFGIQRKFVEEGKDKVKHIIRFESINEDVRRIGLPELPKHKSAQTVASKKFKHYEDAFRLKDKMTVYQIMKEDYEYFGYPKPY